MHRVNLDMLMLPKHLLRSSLSLRMNIELAKVRVEFLQSLLLGFGIAGIYQNRSEDVERHENEVHPRSDVRNGYWPHLTDDDRAQRGARGRETKAFGADICGEDLG